MQSRKELAEAGRRKLEEFRKSKAQGKATTAVTNGKHTADAPSGPATTATTPLFETNGNAYHPPSGNTTLAKSPAVAAHSVAFQGTIAPQQGSSPVLLSPIPAGSAQQLAGPPTAPVQPLDAEPSPAKAPATTFVVLQDAPIPFGAPSPPVGPASRPPSSSGVTPPTQASGSSSGVFPWLPVSNPAISVAQRNSTATATSSFGEAQSIGSSYVTPAWDADRTAAAQAAPSSSLPGPGAAAAAGSSTASSLSDPFGSRPYQQPHEPEPLAQAPVAAPYAPAWTGEAAPSSGAFGDLVEPRPAAEFAVDRHSEPGPAFSVDSTSDATSGAWHTGTRPVATVPDTPTHLSTLTFPADAMEASVGQAAGYAGPDWLVGAGLAPYPSQSPGAAAASAFPENPYPATPHMQPAAETVPSGPAAAEDTLAVAGGAVGAAAPGTAVEDSRPAWLAYSAAIPGPTAGFQPIAEQPAEAHSALPYGGPESGTSSQIPVIHHEPQEARRAAEEAPSEAWMPSTERGSAGAAAASVTDAALWGSSAGYDQLADSYLSPSRSASVAVFTDHAAAAPALSPLAAATPMQSSTSRQDPEASSPGGLRADAAPVAAGAASPLLPLSFPALSPAGQGAVSRLGMGDEAPAAPAQAASSTALQEQPHARSAPAPRTSPAPSRFAWLFGTPKTQPAEESPSQVSDMQPSLAVQQPVADPTGPTSSHPAMDSGFPLSSHPDTQIPQYQLSFPASVAPALVFTPPPSGAATGFGGSGAAPEELPPPRTAWDSQSALNGDVGAAPSTTSSSYAGTWNATGARYGTWEATATAAPLVAAGERSGLGTPEADELSSARSPDPHWPGDLPGQRSVQDWSRGSGLGGSDAPAESTAAAGGLSWGGGAGEGQREGRFAAEGLFSDSTGTTAAGPLGLRGSDSALPSFLRSANAGSTSERVLSSAGADAGGAPWETVTPSAPSFTTSFLTAAPPHASAPAPSSSLPPRPPAPPQPPAAASSANPQFAATASYLSAYSAHGPAQASTSYGGAAAPPAATSSYLESYLDNLLATMPAGTSSSDDKGHAASADGNAGAANGMQNAGDVSLAGSPRASQSGEHGAAHARHPDAHDALAGGSSGEGRGLEDAGDGSAAYGAMDEHAVSSSGFAGDSVGGMRIGMMSRPESSTHLRGHHSRRASVDSAGVVSVYSHATGPALGPGGMGASSTSNRAQFAALQQHIDELTEEKMALSRGLQQQTRMNENLAEENEALMLQYNARGAAMEELQRKVKQYEQELQAQALSLEGFSEERHAARSSYAEASSRAQALAAEVVGLESQLLQLKSSVLKAERAAEEAQQRARKLEKQVATLAQEAGERSQELQQVQLKGRNLVVRLKQTEAKLQAAEEKLEVQAALGGMHGPLASRLANGHNSHAPAAAPPPKPTAEQEVQCDLAAELPPAAAPHPSTAAATASQQHSRSHSLTTAQLDALVSGGPSHGGLAAEEGVSAATQAPRQPHDSAAAAAEPGRQLAIVPSSAAAAPEPAHDGPEGTQQQPVDWSAARPQHDAPSAVVAEHALSCLDTSALRRGQGLPEGLDGVAVQLARWLPAGPVSGGDPVSLMVEEELRLMQSVHELIANFEEAQEDKAAQIQELRARVESLTQENDDLRRKLELQTQRLELHLQGSMAAPSGIPLSLHQTPAAAADGPTTDVANVTPPANISFQPTPVVSVSVDPLSTPTRSAPSMDGRNIEVGSAGPSSRQSWMGYLFRSRQKKRVRSIL